MYIDEVCSIDSCTNYELYNCKNSSYLLYN